jgi:hypothetical protein
MVSAVHEICHMDSEDFVGPICHPPIATASIFGITGVAEVVVKLVLRLKPLHVLTLRDKVLCFTLCKKYVPVFFSQIFVHTEGVHIVPPMLHMYALVGPPSMKDDLHSYLLPLLL